MEAHAPIGIRRDEEIAASSDPWVSAWASPEALFHAHYARLVEAIAAASGDYDGASDAVQDAFVQLWIHWEDVRLYEDPVGWVRRVAINRAYNRRRSLARRAAALLRLTERSRTDPVEPEPMDSAVLAAFRALPERQRLAMSLYYVADLSVAEVCHVMGVGEGSVKRHLHRGRDAMRRSLEVER